MLANRLKKANKAKIESKPKLFNLADKKDYEKLNKLVQADSTIQIIDTYQKQLQELFVFENPHLHANTLERDREFAKYVKQHYGDQEPWYKGRWIYIPWRKALIHLLVDAQFQKVRTSRNRNLITASEQQKYYHSVIGIAGLSVGNSCALALVLTGGAKHLRLADPDTLELTNLNRIRGSIAELTAPKVYMTARQIYEIDPYANIETYPEGLNEKNIPRFFDGPPKLDVVIDEIDSIAVKIRIRQEAKKRKIPVVMAADNGEGGVLDIERHDLDENTPFFHARAGDDVAERVLGKKLSLPIIGKIITEDLIGVDVVTPRMQKSLLEVGKSLPTWPQLGGAATVNGAAVAMAVRYILTSQPLIRNRAILSLESWLIPRYESASSQKRRRKGTTKFIREFRKHFSDDSTSK